MVKEQNPGSNWKVEIAGSPVTVQAGQTGNATVTNILQSGVLNVVTSVNWGNITPVTSQTFEVCVTGPSHPNPNCQFADYNGSTLIWPDLAPGSYAVTQNAGSAWGVTITGNPANVAVNQTSSVFIDYAISPASMKLTVSADKSRVSAGEQVTYDYLVENTGGSSISNLVVAGSNCAPIAYASGDANGNNRLDAQESWRFQCQINVEADTNNRATATGNPPFGGPISSNRSGVLVDVIPSVTLTKSVSPAFLPEPGGQFTYQLSLRNQSSEPVRITNLEDSYALSASCQNLVTTEIAVGQTVSCTYPVTHTEPGEYTNTATVTVVDDEGNPVAISANASASVVGQPASIELSYDSPQTVPSSGTIAKFTVQVRNTSPGDEVTITSLADSIAGDLTQAWLPIESTNCALPQTLGVSGSSTKADTYTCTVDIRVEGAHGTLFTHYLTARGSDDDGGSLQATDSTSILIFDESAELSLEVIPATTSLSEPGGEVEYTVRVINESASSSIVINQMLASTFGPLTAESDTILDTSCVLPQTLLASQNYECTFRASVEGNPSELIESTVVASGMSSDQEPVTAFQEVTVEIVDLPSSLQVSVTAAHDNLPESGGEVTFDVTIRNSSSVDTVMVNALLDGMLGNQGVNCSELTTQPLLPSDQVVCRYSGFIKGDSGQTYTHKITATGIDDDGLAVNAEGSVPFNFTDLPSKISVTYRANKETVPSAGEPVVYSVEVRNDSVADLVTITSFIDSRYGDITLAGGDDGELLDTTCELPTRLDPGQPYLCTFRATVSGQLGDERVNELSVSGEDDDQVALTQKATTSLLIAEPILSAVKRAELIDETDDIASPGEQLRYIITVENQGNAVASDVRLTDILGAQLQLIAGSVQTTQGIVSKGNGSADQDVQIELATIEPGDTVIVQFDVYIASDLSTSATTISNQAILTGENFPSTSTRSPKGDGPTVTAVRPVARLSAQKSAMLDTDQNGDGLASPGDTIAYEIKIFNRGQIAATGVLLDDVLDNNINVVAGSVSTTQGEVQSGNADGDSLVQVAIGELAPDSSATVRFIVQVKAKLSSTQIANQAVITSQGLSAIVTDDPSTAVENDPTITSLNGEAILEATKADLLLLDNDANGRASDGDRLVYQITVQNRGSGTASDVRLLDTLDANTSLVVGSVQTDQGEVVLGNGADEKDVEVVIGDIPSGERVSISFQATIRLLDDNENSGLINQAMAQSKAINGGLLQVRTDDPAIAGAQNPTFTPIDPGPVLLLTNEDFLLIDANEDGIFSPNDTILYRITVENVGTEAAQSIIITDKPDAKTKIVPGSVQSDGGVVISGNQLGDEEVIVEIAVLNSGEKTTISFLTKIASDTIARVVINQAELSLGPASNVPAGQSLLLSDDPDTSMENDPTVTVLAGVTVFYVPIFDSREPALPAAKSRESLRILLPSLP